MLKNHLLIALRTIRRDGFHTTIKILGLAVGIAACLTMYQLVAYELNFDRFHANRDRIYRVYTQFGGKFESKNPGIASGLPKSMEEGVVGAEAFTHFYQQRFPVVSIDRGGQDLRRYNEIDPVAVASPDYFKVFSSYEWLEGSPETSLSQPFQVVLTNEQAQFYFGVEDPTDAVGKYILYQDSLEVQVSGIVKAFEEPTDFTFSDFLSYATIEASWLKEDIRLNDWESVTSNSQVFMLLQPQTPLSSVEEQLDAFIEPHMKTYDEFGWTVDYHLQALADLHLNPDMGIFSGSRSPTQKSVLYGILVVAFLLLVIASINYINLATAQAFKRGKEVGVRKVLGGSRNMLIRQFLGETFLISLAAILFSILLTELSFGLFKEFFPEELSFRVFSRQNLGFYLALLLLLTISAGTYPAFILSSFLPDRALKSSARSYKGNGGNLWLRKGLIVIQFAVAIALIIGTYLSSRQIQYLLDKDLGFQQEAILTFFTPFREPESKQKILREELLALPAVKQVSRQNRPPSSFGYNTMEFTYEQNGELTSGQLNIHRIDTAYFSLFEIPLLYGRNIFPSDTLKELVVNEAFVRHLGLDHAEEAIGKVIKVDEVSLPIVGVVKDFHHKPLTQQIEPLLLGAGEYRTQFGVKLNKSSVQNLGFEPITRQIKQTYKEIYPDAVFETKFYDETIAGFYEEEARLSNLAQTATGIALFLSCMGLFGLISLSVVQRTKEIGIRKVLGASVKQIVGLLSQEYLLLIGIAFLIASPIVYYFMEQWLSDFVYRVPLGLWVFVLAGALTALLAFLTIGMKSFSAARANPIEALRAE